MAANNLGAFLHGLRRLVGTGDGASLGDGQLLERFLKQRDEAAFEVLLWRHGPMVLGVCRRVLGCEQDVEDAFQAAFLTLVRKAGSISRRGSLGSWLYRVSHRIALAARASAARRVRLDRTQTPLPAVDPDPTPVWRDLRRVLDEEIGRLPEKYRLPVVLCYLEGRSSREAAEEMGCPVGTLTSRLTRACQRLAARLTRRGLTLPAGGLAVALAGEATATVPAALVGSTMQLVVWGIAGTMVAAGGVSGGAAALMEGVIRAMWLTKLKVTAAVILSVGMLAGGSGWLAYHAEAGDGEGSARQSAAQPASKGKETAAQRKSVPAKQCPEAARHNFTTQNCLSCHVADSTPGLHVHLVEENSAAQQKQRQAEVEQARRDLQEIYVKIQELEVDAHAREHGSLEDAEAMVRQMEKEGASQRRRLEEELRTARQAVDRLRERLLDHKIEVAALARSQTETSVERLRALGVLVEEEEKRLKELQAQQLSRQEELDVLERKVQERLSRLRAQTRDTREKARQQKLRNEAARAQHQIELEVAKERYRDALRALPRVELKETKDSPELEKRIDQLSRELQELRRHLKQRQP